MSKLTLEDIKKLSDLAKIEINQEEEKYLKDINNILEHLALVSNAKTEELENSVYFENITREDVVVAKNFDREILLKNIPDKSNDNYVKVSKVLNK